MKKIVIFIAAVMIIASFAAIGIGKKAENTQTNIVKQIEISNEFLKPIITDFAYTTETFSEIEISGELGLLHSSGKPILPVSRTTIDLPFGSKITDITYDLGEIQTMKLSNKIVPSPQAIPTNMINSEPVYKKDISIYESTQYYPNNWFKIETFGGLDENNNHVTIANIQKYPVRYSPQTDTIGYVDKIDLTITYESPSENPFPTVSTYDLVIIAPNEFSSELQSFVTHKNKYEVKTILKTTEEIYSEYDGFDKPEQIKYFIKDAIEEWGIKYVLLVGGMTSMLSGSSRDDTNQGSVDWYVPVRYTNNREMGSTYDPGFVSDLYYADIYDGEGAFSSWDNDRNGNADGVYASWKSFGGTVKDIIDLYPDVMVGRLACRSLGEVRGVTEKIIDYERLKHDGNWYNNMILIGGDSHDDAGTNYNEGEVACDYVANDFMSEFNHIKLYASHGKDADTTNDFYIPSPTSIQQEVTAGAGHLLFDGHGHPGSWNTHWPGEYNWGDTPGGIDITEFSKLRNAEKLPVCVIGGCHNSQFNVTLLATTLDQPFMWTHGMPVGECFAWQLVKMTTGGTIASLGNTGLGYGNVGNHGDLDGDGVDDPDTVEGLGGYQIQMFYKTLDEGKQFLGEAWKGSTNKYLDTYPGMDDQTDCKTVQQWPLLGDPSLKIGGYQTDDKSKVSSDIFEKFPNLVRLLEFPIVQLLLKYL